MADSRTLSNFKNLASKADIQPVLKKFMQKNITTYQCVRCWGMTSSNTPLCEPCELTLANLTEPVPEPISIHFSAEEKELLLRLLFEDRSTTYGDAADNHNRAILKLQGRPVLF